jgi:hypothetical protein
MKGIITSLSLLALELTLCLVSPHWRSIDVTDAQICFKPLLARFNTSSMHHQYLHIGPLFSSRIVRIDNTPQHFPSKHARMETALFVSGVAAILISAIILSVIEFCTSRKSLHRCRRWFYLINVILLMVSLVTISFGYYSLEHHLQQPMNGTAALGFYIGILFIVVLGTHSAITFWTHPEDMWNVNMEKMIK